MDLEKVRLLLENGFYYGTDEMLHREIPRKLPVDDHVMWVFNGPTLSKCEYCMGIHFQILGQLPSYALSCYKVVASPRTLDELFELRKLQIELNLPSKCGVDARMSVEGMYKGYFYNESLEQGLACYKLVRSKLDPGINVILKRGCTEFEHTFGDSKEWKVPAEQVQFEKDLRNMYRPELASVVQPKDLKKWMMRKWVFWARSVGDMTYKKYAPNPLYPPYRTYHDEEKEK